MFILILFSFYQYYKEQYGYVDYYYQIKEECYEKRNENYSLCKRFSGNIDQDGTEISYDELVKDYVINLDPVKKYRSLDSITLTSEIVENTNFAILQFLSPLLICIAVVGTIHCEISTGYITNYFTRSEYSLVFKRYMKKIAQIALIVPISLIFIFVISSFITNFNFNISETVKGMSVYSEWKYQNFLLYGCIICFAQFILSFCYGLIAFASCFHNKSKIVSIIMGYVMNLIMIIFVLMGVYTVLINKILGIKNLYDYFSLTGYYYFNGDVNYYLVCFIPIVLLIVLITFIRKRYGKKSQVVMMCEKHMG